MASWISGCHFKKYHEPLTPEILQRLYDAKEGKKHAETLKQEALNESKEWVIKIKNHRNLHENQTITVCNKKPKIFQITKTSGNKDHLRSYVHVQVGLKGNHNVH